MSDLTRCPHCGSVVYIDDRYCNDCHRDMHGPKPGNKADKQSGNE